MRKLYKKKKTNLRYNLNGFLILLLFCNNNIRLSKSFKSSRMQIILESLK